MYYEEAEVREYNRKDKKTGVEKPYYQIRLKKDSKFNEAKPIGLVNLSEIKELINSSDVAKYNELEANFNETSVEVNELKQQIQELKASNGTLSSEVEILKSEKVKLEDDLKIEKEKYNGLLEDTNSKIDVANANVIEAKDKVFNVQKEKEAIIEAKDNEIKELNSKLNDEKDFSKKLLAVINSKDNDIVYLAERGLTKRIINKLPERIENIVRKAKQSEEIEIK